MSESFEDFTVIDIILLVALILFGAWIISKFVGIHEEAMLTLEVTSKIVDPDEKMQKVMLTPNRPCRMSMVYTVDGQTITLTNLCTPVTIRSVPYEK